MKKKSMQKTEDLVNLNIYQITIKQETKRKIKMEMIFQMTKKNMLNQAVQLMKKMMIKRNMLMEGLLIGKIGKINVIIKIENLNNLIRINMFKIECIKDRRLSIKILINNNINIRNIKMRML